MTSLLPTLPRVPTLHPRAVLQWVKEKAVPLPSFPLVGRTQLWYTLTPPDWGEVPAGAGVPFLPPVS